MSELKKEWFEPGKNFKTMFGEHVRKNRMRGISVEECISAAFRALLAEEERVEFAVGDVVRLERYESKQGGLGWFESEAHRIGTCGIIKDFDHNGCCYLRVDSGNLLAWPVSALTLVRRAGEAAPGDKHADEIHRLQSELHARNDEITGLRAEVERLKSECSDQQRYVLDLESAIASKETRIKVLEVANDSLTQYSSNLTSERDTLQEKYSRLEINSGEWLQQRDALQTQLLQVESFVRENNAPPARISKLINQRQELAILNSKYIEAKHQRDALRARIDAGVPVTEMTGHSYELPRWFEGLVKTNDDQRTGILLIDARPIDQPDAAMVDERTGKADRREVGCDASLEARLAIGRDHTRVYVDDLDCNGTVKCARSNDRRRTTGTIADRDKP